MSDWKPKRFWKEARAVEAEDGHSVQLDGRPVRTPAKAALVLPTRAMAEAWSGQGITANAIGPGFFPTELTAAVFNDDARAARNAAQTCIGRNGCPEDMDGPILFLCSEASGYVTGQTLMVDGGFTAK